MLVVEDPGTSSPGLAFLLATIAGSARPATTPGRSSGPPCAPTMSRSPRLGRRLLRRLLGGTNEGDRPMVVSYASSPVAEVVFDPRSHRTRPPASCSTAASARWSSRASSRAPRSPCSRVARRLPAEPAGPGGHPAQHVRVPGPYDRGPAGRLPGLRRAAAAPLTLDPARSTRTGSAGSRHGPSSSCAEPPGGAAAGAPAGRVPAALLRVAGGVHRRARAGPPGGSMSRHRRGLDAAVAAGYAGVHGGARGRHHDFTLLVGLPAAWVFARFTFPGKTVAARAVHRALRAADRGRRVGVPGAAGPAQPGQRAARRPPGSRTPGAAGRFHDGHRPRVVFYNVAVIVRLVGGLWAHLDPRLEEAARVLGASPWRAFREMTWPLLRPAVLSATSIVFLFSSRRSAGAAPGCPRPGDAGGGDLPPDRDAAGPRRSAAALALVQMVGVVVLLLAHARCAGATRGGAAAAPAARWSGRRATRREKARGGRIAGRSRALPGPAAAGARGALVRDGSAATRRAPTRRCWHTTAAQRPVRAAHRGHRQLARVRDRDAVHRGHPGRDDRARRGLPTRLAAAQLRRAR